VFANGLLNNPASIHEEIVIFRHNFYDAMIRNRREGPVDFKVSHYLRPPLLAK